MKRIAPSIAVALLAASASISLAAGPASARVRHHRTRYHPMRDLRAASPPPGLPAAARQAAPPPHSFYPENVEGGVAGNLPFNNQIRKFTDPLNANGGR